MKIVSTFLLLLMVLQGNLQAQSSEGSTTGFSYVLADISYSSDAVFLGRRDSIEAPYVLGSLGYFDKSGFYGNASASYLVSSEEEKFDLFLLTAGYLYTKNKLSLGLSGTKYFFDDESYNVQSEIEGNVTALLGYDFDVAEITLNAAGYFGNGSSSDLVTSLILDHTFYALNKKLLLTPAIFVDAGTQYFYEEYYNTSRMGNRKSGDGGQKGPGGGNGNMSIMQTEGNDVTLSEASEFNVLNIGLRLPVRYYHKSFIFSFSPMLAFPQTPASITTEDGIFKEELDSVFYWSAGISYWFKI